jgi:hypothetical protein
MIEFAMIELASKSPPVINCTVNKSKQFAILKILIFTRTWMTRQHTLFSDESRFSLCFSDGRYRVYRSRAERFTDQCVHESDRFGGGSAMMWASICHDGRTQLKIVQGTLNAVKYRDDILDPIVLPFLQQRHSDDVFRHDNARCHVARVCQDFLNQNHIRAGIITGYVTN